MHDFNDKKDCTDLENCRRDFEIILDIHFTAVEIFDISTENEVQMKATTPLDHVSPTALFYYFEAR